MIPSTPLRMNLSNSSKFGEKSFVFVLCKEIKKQDFKVSVVLKSCFQSHVNLKLNVTVRGPILDFWSCFVYTDMCLTSLMTDGD